MKKFENLKSKKKWILLTAYFIVSIIALNSFSKNNIDFSISSFETTTSTSTTTTEPKFDIKSSDYCYGWPKATITLDVLLEQGNKYKTIFR